jgi:hypothetical protein
MESEFEQLFIEQFGQPIAVSSDNWCQRLGDTLRWTQEPTHTVFEIGGRIQHLHAALGKVFSWNAWTHHEQFSIFDINKQQLEGSIHTSAVKDCNAVDSSIYLSTEDTEGNPCVKVWDLTHPNQASILTFYEPRESNSAAGTMGKYTEFGLSVVGDQIYSIKPFSKKRDSIRVYQWDRSNKECIQTGEPTHTLTLDLSIHPRDVSDCKCIGNHIILVEYNGHVHILSRETGLKVKSIQLGLLINTDYKLQIVDSKTAIVFTDSVRDVAAMSIIDIEAGTMRPTSTESILSSATVIPMQGFRTRNCSFSDSLAFFELIANSPNHDSYPDLTGINVHSLDKPVLVNHISLPPKSKCFYVDSEHSAIYVGTSTGQLHQYQFPAVEQNQIPALLKKISRK